MSDRRNQSPKLTAFLSVLTLIGTLGTALLANWDKVFPPNADAPPERLPSTHVPSEPPPSSDRITINLDRPAADRRENRDSEYVESLERRIESLERRNAPATNAPPERAPDPPPKMTAPKPQPGVREPYAWLSSHPVRDGDLAGKTAWQLDIMRNSIYARHGRGFKDVDLQDYFDTQTWYRRAYDPDEFPNSLLSDLEVDNATYILRYQERTGLTTD